MNDESRKLVPMHQNSDIDRHSDFAKLLADNLEIALSALSAKNRAEYESTFSNWSAYIGKLGLDPYFFELMKVRDYLIENDWSFNTRKVRLAHLRKFAEILALADDNNEYGFAFNFGRLALLKPKSLGGKKQVIPQRSLTIKQVYKVFDSLAGDSNRSARNRAIMGLLLLAGLRASEAVALKWEHIDYDKNTLLVFEGKGDKSLHIPMLGDLPQLLREWQSKLPVSHDFQYVCTWITRGDNLRGTNQLATGVINRLVKEISQKTGIEFRPHDTRRTAITTLLDAGASVPETRDFARHSSGETTLRYAQKTDAKVLGSKLDSKLKYGAVLGDMKASEQTRYFECSNGHKFNAIDATECPKCGSTDMKFQASFFDDKSL